MVEIICQFVYSCVVCICFPQIGTTNRARSLYANWFSRFLMRLFLPALQRLPKAAHKMHEKQKYATQPKSQPYTFPCLSLSRYETAHRGMSPNDMFDLQINKTIRVCETSIQSHSLPFCGATPNLVINLSYRFDFINFGLFAIIKAALFAFHLIQPQSQKQMHSAQQRKSNLFLVSQLHDWIWCIGLNLYLSLVSLSSIEKKKINHTGQTDQSVSA